ncbi:hypothetical protein GL284_20615 [Paracoccus sp. DK608]|uniref:HTH luxR-type domain-containing protein n=2 Tax=Paracoccus shanxieyensis TaxID=2675752 RepID=A0A6L6J5L3_9RHOB|nr:hypothetical protein [Paracoccus shanxieyensis]MTH89894.1 hypothetical protein [Paracoccus shanxieyensis]
MVWTVVPEMTHLDARLRVIAPMGYSLVIHVRSLTPEYYVSTYPEGWVEIYTERQYAMFDPINLWARTNSGRTRWSEVQVENYSPASGLIMERARDYGLNYGCGVSRSRIDEYGTLSCLFCAREDRELSDSELDEVESIFNQLLAAVEAARPLSDIERAILSHLAHGLPYKEIAHLQGVSTETIKKRLERIRELLGARNSVQAVAIATKRGLILNQPAAGPD